MEHRTRMGVTDMIKYIIVGFLILLAVNVNAATTKIVYDTAIFGESGTNAKLLQLGPGATKGCLKFNYPTGKMQFSHDCSAYEDMAAGGLSAWVSAKAYEIGNVVYYTDNYIYRCTTANSDVAFTPAKWQMIGGSPLGYTAEDVANKSTNTSLGTSDVLYPTQNAVKVYADTKEPALTKGNLTEATSSVLTISNGTSAVIGSGTTIQVKDSTFTDAGAATASQINAIYNNIQSGSVISNGSFESWNNAGTTVNGWSDIASSTISKQLQTYQAYNNLAYIRTVADASGDGFYQRITSWPAAASQDSVAICNYSFRYKQGTNFSFQIYDGATYLINSALTASTNWTWVNGSFSCPASASTWDIRFYASGAGTIDVDDIQVGNIQKKIDTVKQYVVYGQGNGGTAITASTTNITWTEVTDTDGLWNGTVFTSPTSGTLEISGALDLNAAVVGSMMVYKNNSYLKVLSSAQATGLSSVADFSGMVNVVAGDQISIRSPTSGTIENTADHNITFRLIASNEAVVDLSQAGMNGWASYAANPVSQGMGSVTGNLYYKRDGSDLLIRGKITTGTCTAVEARIGLPSGLISADTNVIVSKQLAGSWTRTSATAEFGTLLIEPSVAYLTVGRQAASLDGLSKLNGSSAFNNSEDISVNARIPIQGWTTASAYLVNTGFSDRQYDLTVTGTNWTTISAVGIPYQTSNGVWRMRGNIRGSFSTGTLDTWDISISGVTFPNYGQHVGASPDSNIAVAFTRSYALSSSSTMRFAFPTSQALRDINISYDVALSSKPTFVP